MQVIVVDQTAADSGTGGFGAAAGRAIRMIATPGTHIIDPLAETTDAPVLVDER